MGEGKPEEVKDHWMILRCGYRVWNRWRKANPETRPDIEDAHLRDAHLWNANLWNAKFRYANLEGANLWNANLGTASLEGAHLEGAHLEGANLVGADLRAANLQNANFGSADLRVANLVNADLVNANLVSADLRAASLVNADLRAASLVNANLEGAHLEGASLRNASLWNADLRAANLQNADLGTAGLWNANLGTASLEGANLVSTHFHSVDLREVQGLERVNHQGPSPVSSQTLKKSQGQIPEVFLKGCGLEDWEILSAKLHDPNLRPDQVTDIGYQVIAMRASSPIVPFSVFISYCHEDQRFVDKLGERFDQERIRYWRDVHDLKAGPIEAQVDNAIGLQRATLLVLSKDSVLSDWVELEAERAREVEKARQEKGETGYVLCPIALDESWKDSRWPRRIRNQIEKYSILDFSRWGSDEEFGKQFERLKTGLRIYYADNGKENS